MTEDKQHDNLCKYTGYKFAYGVRDFVDVFT